MSKNSLAPRRPCKGRGTACGGRVGGEGHEVARGLFSSAFTIHFFSQSIFKLKKIILKGVFCFERRIKGRVAKIL